MAHNLLNYAATSHGQKYYQVLLCISFMSSPQNCAVSNIHQGTKVNFSLPDEDDMFKSEQTIHSKRLDDLAKKTTKCSLILWRFDQT